MHGKGHATRHRKPETHEHRGAGGKGDEEAVSPRPAVLPSLLNGAQVAEVIINGDHSIRQGQPHQKAVGERCENEMASRV